MEADNIATVRVLLCAGADVTMKKYSGDTVLHLAKSTEMKRFVEGLVANCFLVLSSATPRKTVRQSCILFYLG